jgi:outer membrane protein OmpA-like peptidoglycan-associated protein
VLLAAYAVPVAAQQTAIDGGPAVNDPGPADRQPDTDQLLVTRPGRLLFPPRRAPRRPLVAETPAAPTPTAPMAAQDPELTSRLLVPLVPQQAQPMPPSPVAPSAETPLAAAEPTAPPPAPVTLEPWVSAQPEPAQPEPAVPKPTLPVPAQAAVAPPVPAALAEELMRSPAPAEPSRSSVAEAISAPPPEPAVRPAAPSPELVAPELVAPAPIVTKTEPPPPPPESLTSKPAVEPQTAALAPAPVLAEQIRVLFPDGSIELNDDARRRLSAVAMALQENTTLRIQILAYANSNADGTNRARRLSLSRALAVRAYLIEREVRATRMNVRALGDKTGDGPADRVDILPEAAN